MAVSKEAIDKFIELTKSIEKGDLKKYNDCKQELETLGVKIDDEKNKPESRVYKQLMNRWHLGPVNPIELAIHFRLANLIMPLRNRGNDINKPNKHVYLGVNMPWIFFAVRGRVLSLDLVNAFLNAGADLQLRVPKRGVEVGNVGLESLGILFYLSNEATIFIYDKPEEVEPVLETLSRRGASFLREEEEYLINLYITRRSKDETLREQMIKIAEFLLRHGINLIKPGKEKTWYVKSDLNPRDAGIAYPIFKTARELIELSQGKVEPDPKKIAEMLSLLKTGLNGKGLDGKTALHYAVENNLNGLAVALIRSGASLDILNEAGLTPRDYIRRQGTPYLKATTAIIELKKAVLGIKSSASTAPDTKVVSDKLPTTTAAIATTAVVKPTTPDKTPEPPRPLVFSGSSVTVPAAAPTTAVATLASSSAAVSSSVAAGKEVPEKPTPSTSDSEKLAEIEKLTGEALKLLETGDNSDPKWHDLKIEFGQFIAEHPLLFAKTYHKAYSFLREISKDYPEYEKINKYLSDILLWAPTAGYTIKTDMDGNPVELVSPAGIEDKAEKDRAEEARVDALIMHSLLSPPTVVGSETADASHREAVGALMAQGLGVDMEDRNFRSFSKITGHTSDDMLQLYHASKAIINDLRKKLAVALEAPAKAAPVAASSGETGEQKPKTKPK